MEQEAMAAPPPEAGAQAAALEPKPTAPPPFVPMPLPRAGAYAAASVMLALTQGLGMNLVSANLPQVQGAIGATGNEATWLIAAYMAPNVSLSLALIKIRNQYGLRNFAELSILAFVVASLLNLFADNLHSAIAVRFMSGMAASPMSSLGFLYMLEPFPPARKMGVGLCAALTNTALAGPLARILSPHLFDLGQWHGLMLMEAGMAMIAFGFVYMLPLTPIPRVKVIEKLDVASYLLIAAGFGSLAVVLSLGRLYWWLEAPWLGWLTALSIACVTVVAAIELNRKNPLIDIRWLASPAVLHFTAALIVFRIVLAEQSSGAIGLFQLLGLSNEQMTGLNWIILGSSLLGGALCAGVMKQGREPAIHAAALLLIGIGAAMDSSVTNLTRPEQMYLSQALIAFAGALFLPPAVLAGLMSALRNGPNYILSFVIVFLGTQSLGGLIGSAVFGTFVTMREKFHSSILVEHLALTDPQVALRVGQLGGAYGKVIADKAVANAEGAALLAGQATREANVLAYGDAFLVIAVLSFAALAALLAHMAHDALRRPALQPAAA
jgi:MFS family permease